MRNAIVAGALGLAFILPAAAHARPADVNIVNTAPIQVAVSGTPTVRIDRSANSVQLVGQPTVTSVQTGFTRLARVLPASGDTNSCTDFDFSGSGKVLLQNVAVTQYASPTTPIAYLKPIVTLGPSSGLIMNLRIPLTASEPDSGNIARSGILNLGMIAGLGGIAKAGQGEVYSLAACLNHVSGEASSAVFVLTGVVVN